MELDEVLKVVQVLSKKAKPEKPVWEVGKQYLIRTVTHYLTGKLEAFTKQELLLSDAAWIADTGRYYDALRDGKFNEVEPLIGNAIIGRGAIVDAVEWRHKLPKDQQ
jgi:hypothetical protein